ncbi:MAG: hypothetical protein IKE58_05940 [Blautia sp.]|nr:hypothetical protein [Blautia sp.]
MKLILPIILSCLWLVLLPAGIGASLEKGYLVLFTLMELLALPMIFLQAPLHILVLAYGICLGALGLAGLIRNRQRIHENLHSLAALNREGGLALWLGRLLIVFQMAFSSLFAHMDADDAFYVGTAVTDVATDSIYRYNPYTGYLYEHLPKRYVLSPFPAFTAVMSRLCGGINPAAFAHRVLPPVFLLLIYTVLARWGNFLFPRDRKKQGLFLFFSALVMQFSSWSIYNAGNFAMIRLWQGKALLAGGLLPLLICQGLEILMAGQEEKSDWFFFFLNCLSCCFVSSMGILLAPLATGGLILMALLGKRKPAVALTFLACCLPCILLAIIRLAVL